MIPLSVSLLHMFVGVYLHKKPKQEIILALVDIPIFMICDMFTIRLPHY